ncbi:MAG: pilus assembly protein TadG-related protein [Roseburia faecis]|nr:pilus assembly protein TadG-related protein [Roseburia faecis]
MRFGRKNRRKERSINTITNKTKECHSEDGAIMVIAAIVMVVLFGFAAFAIDMGSWRAAQKEYQNAADAAALNAASKRYKTGVSQKEATKFAFQAASLNDMTLSEDEMTVTYDESAKTATVIIRKPTNNYFSIAITGRDETMISVEATAGLDIIKSEDDAPFGVNAAVEALGDLTWSGGSGCVVEGSAVSGGNLTITSGVTFTKGDVSGDGFVTINPGSGFNVNNVFSGGDLTLNTNAGVVNGDVECGGNFLVSSGSYTFGRNIKSNGTLTINSNADIGGNVQSNGTLLFNATGITLHGSAQSNTQVAINGGGIPIVDGVFYKNGYLQSYQEDGLKKEDGSAATIENDDTIDDFAGIKHGNYKWRWEKLENYLSYGGGKSDTEPYTVADADMFYNYLKDEYNASQYENWKACIGFWDGNYDFWNGSDINKFLTYCREHGKGDNYPVYFPGSVTLDQGTPIAMDGAIVVAKDFKMNTMTTQNGSGSGNRIAVVSLNGDITLGNSGMKNVINGAVIDLKQGGRIQLNGGGVINGGVISKGTIVMDGVWNVTADTEWQGAIQPKSSKTKMLIRLK